MNSKKGYTLVELITTIAILALVVCIATASYISISRKVKESQFKSLVKVIENAGTTFYKDTLLEQFTVQSLVDESYLQGDNYKGNIFDPRDKNEILNCYKLQVKDKVAKLIINKEEKDCDFDAYLYTKIRLYYTTCKNDNCQISENDNEYKGEWLNKPSLFYVKIFEKNNTEIISNDIEYNWTLMNIEAPDIIKSISTSKSVKFDDNIENQYKITANYNNKTYTKNSPIKIDLVKPTVNISNPAEGEEYVKNVTLNFKFTDNESKLNSYCILEDSNDNNKCNWESIVGEKFSKSIKYSSNNTINVFVKDNAGNINDTSYRIGNIGEKPRENKLTITSKNSSYNSINTILSVSLQDDISQMSKFCIIEKLSTDSAPSTPSASDSCFKYVAKESFDYKFNESEGSGKTKKLYLYVLDKEGKVTDTVLINSYTLYTSCSEKTTTYGSYGSCSKSCGGGIKYRDLIYKDKYLGKECSRIYNSDSSSCNNQSCCSEGSWSYSYCSSYGYKVYERYNGCTGRYESQTRTYEYCTTSTTCGSYGNCSANGWQTSTCSYYYGGKEYPSENKIACDSKKDCDSWGSCACSTGQKKRKCTYKNGGREISTTQTEDCSVCKFSEDCLFGSRKGSPSNNYGSYNSSIYISNCTSGARYGGWLIKCAKKAPCGDYYGETAKYINSHAGCSKHFSTYWC